MADSFVEIARFASRLEAEAIGHALDPHGIPFAVRSDDIGMFGPGHTGRTIAGAGLLVPEDRVQEVEQLLACVIRPADEPLEDDDPQIEESLDDENP